MVSVFPDHAERLDIEGDAAYPPARLGLGEKFGRERGVRFVLEEAENRRAGTRHAREHATCLIAKPQACITHHRRKADCGRFEIIAAARDGGEPFGRCREPAWALEHTRSSGTPVFASAAKTRA